MKRLLKFFRIPFFEQMLVIEALLRLGMARFAVLTMPFGRIARMLGTQGRETPLQTLTPEQAVSAQRVEKAIARVKTYTPWDSNCLAQALAARQMLRRFNVPMTVYLGASLGSGKGMIAHAWVRCGKWIITGRNRINRYGIVASFADEETIQ